MNEKPTYELDKILSSVEPEHFNRYRNEEDTDSQMSVSEFFNRYIGSYGLQLSDVIRQSDIPANYAYGILNGNRTNPSRDRVIALCIACHMNLTDTNRALKTAGLSPLYSKVSRDAAITNVNMTLELLMNFCMDIISIFFLHLATRRLNYEHN